MKLLCIKLTMCCAVLGAGAYVTTQTVSGQQLSTTQRSGQTTAFPAQNQLAYPAQNYYGQNPFEFTSTDPEAEKLRASETKAAHEVLKLVAEYSKAEGEAARAKIKSNLSAALEKEFDLQQKRRDLELSAVEERVKKVRTLMQKRSAERPSIVAKRVDQLISEADGLGWTAPAGINLPKQTLPNSGFQAR